MMEIKKSWQLMPALFYFQCRDWNRTSTFLRTADFESAASTNSATRAILYPINRLFKGCNVTTFYSIERNLSLFFDLIICNSFFCEQIYCPAPTIFSLRNSY